MASRSTDALREQLARRRELLRAGARHVGWKIGAGERERIDGSIAVGHLTSATCWDDGDTVTVPAAALHADVEIAVELRRALAADDDLADAIAGYATALEIVDLAPVLDTAVTVVATNVFHRAVAFGPFLPQLPDGPLTGSARVNGELRDRAAAPDDIAGRLGDVARVLALAGVATAPGDRIITGSIVQLPIAPGDDVCAEVSGLGRVRLVIDSRR